MEEQCLLFFSYFPVFSARMVEIAKASDMDVADVGFESLPGYAKLSCNQCL
jgi:hypothetical protein